MHGWHAQILRRCLSASLVRTYQVASCGETTNEEHRKDAHGHMDCLHRFMLSSMVCYMCVHLVRDGYVSTVFSTSASNVLCTCCLTCQVNALQVTKCTQQHVLCGALAPNQRLNPHVYVHVATHQRLNAPMPTSNDEETSINQTKVICGLQWASQLPVILLVINGPYTSTYCLIAVSNPYARAQQCT